ncbi:hypothetical protein NUW58_g4135 [Xylaria curta]|uniref:Uncharacterized protein n=1 Tax=Xylaria curta TaxID=42375 RepID=A0ACC1P920_9PEZI|nr:hypothetical protein NUW58_g4135 [Xylaria curta]
MATTALKYVRQASSSSYYDDSSFYGRLKKQYRRGKGDIVLRLFDEAAREIHAKWVRKPKGESDATPPLTSFPRASTEPERTSMLNCLAEILEFLSRKELSHGSVADEPMSPTSSRHSKRPSPDEEVRQSPSSKRSRGAMGRSRPPSVLSGLDSGEVRASTPLPKPDTSLLRSSQQSNIYGVAPSSNTSKLSFVSRVFSEPGDPEDDATFPATQETEVTIEAASSQLKRRPSSPSLVESLDPSSTERVIEASFGGHNNLPQNVPELLIQNVPPNDPYSDFSRRSRDVDIRPHENPVIPVDQESAKKYHGVIAPNAPDFMKQLQDVWPVLPAHLRGAPLAVRWEIMRVALYCGTPTEDLDFQYEPTLNDQTRLWDQLRGFSAFKGKVLPEKSRPEAWNAAMSDHFRSTDQVVVLTASLTLNSAKVGPLFKLSLQPLKLDLPHRLDRRFGSDRFLELVMPSPYTKDIKALSKGNEAVILDSIHNWLVEDSHVLLGRTWRSFCVKQATPKKLHKDDTLRPETITILQERIYFFAENGTDFLLADATQSVSPKLETSNSHTKMERKHLLDWLLQIQQNQQNQKQSVYKLFSRITLGLSRTHPTVILQPEQIRHRNADLVSPTGKVMNDGIARMSTALARQIRDVMGLVDIPAGYQGRFGSAKRKWVCDYKEEDHRTFEVRNASKDLKSATLNLQLLPILEDRAINVLAMKEQVGKFMKDSLEAEMKAQKEAMKDPAHFKLWLASQTAEKTKMELLLSQGFDPTKLEFLRRIAFGLRKEKCEELQTRLNVKVGRSTYAYMVVDFNGVLAEDEVHLGFSSKFVDEQSRFSETFLHGMDVLVARTPAHYPSDIQRVKAVFKPELGSLKDVIVFPTKGDTPLADKLSGGDYDGDIAWVCWEPSIVNNFTNAPMPDVPDLFSRHVLTKQNCTYESLSQSCGPRGVTTEFIDQTFRFNMEPNLLGTCTNYKEKLCYSRNSVRDEHAIFLSTLISNLVDRAKQGIVFSEKDWDRERRILNEKQRDAKRAKKRLDPSAPEYKNTDWSRKEPPSHIIDYVKFVAGKPTVERELENLNRYLSRAEKYDKDLVTYIEFYERLKRPPHLRRQDEELGKTKSNTWTVVLDELKKDIEAVAAGWADSSNSRGDFEAKLSNTYEKWRMIEPTRRINSKTMLSLCETRLTGVGLSPWDLLKASYCFKMYYNKSPSFPWYMAGYQLGYLKSIAASQGIHAPPILMTPGMYASTRPDAKFVRAVDALKDGRRETQASGEELEGVEILSDQDE